MSGVATRESTDAPPFAPTAERIAGDEREEGEIDTSIYALLKAQGLDPNAEHIADARAVIAEFSNRAPPEQEELALEDVEIEGQTFTPRRVPVDMDHDDLLPSAGM